MTLEELLCRIICKAEEVDPDKDGIGLGTLMPKGQPYKMWEARRRVARALLDDPRLTIAEKKKA